VEILLVIGKVLFSYLFITSGINHFKSLDAMTGYAKYKKLPLEKPAVIASGVLLVLAPILFIFGILEVLSLVFIAVFLTATAFIFHAYWNETDATAKMNERISFNKEISLVGATLALIALI
jgi:putative oxidoreductase